MSIYTIGDLVSFAYHGTRVQGFIRDMHETGRVVVQDSANPDIWYHTVEDAISPVVPTPIEIQRETDIAILEYLTQPLNPVCELEGIGMDCPDHSPEVNRPNIPNPCVVCGQERIGSELAYRTCGDCGKRWIIKHR